MKKVGIIVGVIAGLLFLAGMLFPAIIWNGTAHIRFKFHIVDLSSSRPIKDARIRIMRGDELQFLADTNMALKFPVTVTDAAGNATVSVMCGAGGSTGLFGKTGRFVISHQLLVEADGYRPLSAGLTNIVGGRRWPLSKRVFDVELVLFKNP
jgi:hypothetical protein